MTVDICIATYKRPEGLAQLLASLERQTPGAGKNLLVVVIDNDITESARGVVEAAKYSRFHTIYDVEPVQNIALARNRGLKHCAGEYVAFIDDDELAAPDWLAQLLYLASSSRADVVFGPVLAELPSEAPAWAKKGGFYDRPRQQTGSAVRAGRTGNALVRRDLLAALGESPFNPSLGLTGGEDYDLFARMSRGGAIMLWCDEAVAYEKVEQKRLTITWLLQRAFRGGQIFADRSGTRPSGLLLALWVLARLAAIPVGVLFAAMIAPFDRVGAIKRLRRAAGWMGQLSTVLTPDKRYREYASR